MKISSVNFEFPCFGLCVEHNDQELIRAYFYNSRLDSRPVIVGDASALSLEIINQLHAYLKHCFICFLCVARGCTTACYTWGAWLWLVVP